MSETATRLEDIDLFGTDDDLPPNDDLDTENNLDLNDPDLDDDPNLDDLDDLDNQDDALGEGDNPIEGEDISTITQLATELGIEPGTLYDLQVPMGDGVEPVSLSEMKDAYQESQRSTQALGDERAAFEQEKIDFNNQISQRQTQAQQVDQRMIDAESQLRQINETYNNIDWVSFERDNPAEAVLQKQKFQEAYSKASSDRDELVSHITQENQTAQENYLNSQRVQLGKLIPEWKDRKTYDEDRVAIRSLLTEYGFSEGDIKEIRDAKAIKLINDFAKLKSGVRNAKPNKDPKEISAVLKTGRLRQVAKNNKSKMDTLVKRAAASSDRKVKAAAVTELLNS